jgi:drug/metabolite transporter (DMT)-like permease
MEPIVFAAVLAAAAMHAGWNAVVKISLDPLLSVVLIALAAALVSAACLPFVPVPKGTVWYWIAASVVLHTGYKLFLVRAYRAGELGQVYPLARGAAPLIVGAASVAFLGEAMRPYQTLGIVVLVAGIWAMAFRGGHLVNRLDRTAVFFAIGTSCFIASYTLVDGTGARRATSAASYTLWLFLLDGLLTAAICFALRGINGYRLMAREWRGGLAGGAMSLGAYWIAIWAMTKAPIAAVAALRETSVLFAVAISAVALREPLTRWRAGAAVVIVGGVALLRL